MKVFGCICEPQKIYLFHELQAGNNFLDGLFFASIVKGFYKLYLKYYLVQRDF